MFKSLRTAFSQKWRLNVEKSEGFHKYYESPVTGDRKVHKSDVRAFKHGKGKPAVLVQGFQPIDLNWLKSAPSGNYYIDGKAYKTEKGFTPQSDDKPALPIGAQSGVLKPTQK